MVQWRTLQFVKISSKRRMENWTPQPRLCIEDLWLIFTSEWSVGRDHWKPKSLRKERKGEKIYWSFTARPAPRTLQSVKDNTTNSSRLRFAVVADILDLSSTERRLEKEKNNSYCVVNKLVYVTPTVRDNYAHSHLIFDLSTSLCFTRVSEGHILCRVIRRNGNEK